MPRGTGPTGDAKWGVWLGLLATAACVVWIAVSKRENLENESSNPRNISLYLRHRFEVMGEFRVGAGPLVTPMLRRPR